MSDQLFQYAQNKFVNPKRIIAANAYQKEDVLRVAIDLDVSDAAKSTVYSDPFKTVEECNQFLQKIPVL